MKATWLAIAAGSLAGLAVLGACSDAPVSKVAGPKSMPVPTDPRFGILGGNHHVIRVCVDPLSPAGVYSFAIAFNTTFAVDSWPEIKDPPLDPDYQGLGINIDQPNGRGPWRTGVDNDQITNPVQITLPGVNCKDALVRFNSCVAADCDTNPFSHTGNRLLVYHNPDQVVNPHAAVNIDATIPAGYTYSVKCITDDPNLPHTGWNTPNAADDCNNTTPIVADPVFVSMNVFHGAQVTYLFTAPAETPCPAGLFTYEIADGVGEENWPAGGNGDLLIRYDQFPAPNDNSYGINAVGWDGGHTFGNLVGSDKAGVQIKNSVGTVVLSFNMDYISQKPGTPSGYGSGGVTDNEGDMLVGTSTGISVTTSLDNNLNKTGFCVAGNCSGGGTNLLVNSPPTINNTSYTLVPGSPYGAWDFHNTYYARISAAKLASMGFDANTWTVQPNATVLHNSPDKDCPLGPFPCDDITVGAKSVDKKEVRVDVNNVNEDQDAFVTGVHITWPQATNGNLLQIKVGGDVIWTGSIGGGSANLALAALAADANKRKIGKHSDEDLKFIFTNNVAALGGGGYTASLDFGDTCNKVILP